jgi:hypothetical protein
MRRRASREWRRRSAGWQIQELDLGSARARELVGDHVASNLQTLAARGPENATWRTLLREGDPRDRPGVSTFPTAMSHLTIASRASAMPR